MLHLKKCRLIVDKVKSKFCNQAQTYGVGVTKTLTKTKKLYKNNVNTLLLYAIYKEISNNSCAFDVSK